MDSYSNRSHLGSHNNPINSKFHHFNSNGLGLNDQTMNHNQALFSSHQTELISQHPRRPTVGQLGLNRRLVNEARTTTSLIPQRVQVVQTVNVDYFPLQNQASLAGSALGDHREFCVAEVVRSQEVIRTQLLNSASARERFLAANHDHYGAWSPSQSQANLKNQANYPIFNTTTETQSFITYRVDQCFNASKSSTTIYFENPRSKQYSSHQYVRNLGFNQNQPSSRKQSATLRLIENDESRAVEVEPVNVVFPTRTKNPIPLKNQVPSNDDDESQNLLDHQDHNAIVKEEDGDRIEEGDGVTHSHPYKKYGPYTCPKCKKVFSTSQLFAAHMGSHYKYENVEQKRKRLLAKYGRKKNYRLINSEKGFNVVFDDQPFRKKSGVENKTNNNVHKRSNIEETDEKKKSEHESVPPAGFQLKGLVDVPVKEEPLEMIN